MIKHSKNLHSLPRVGKWEGSLTKLIEDKDTAGRVKLFAKAVVKPGTEIPLHYHETDMDIFYILSGSGLVNDNGVIVRVESGDIVVTQISEAHSIRNDSQEDLEFISLVIPR